MIVLVWTGSLTGIDSRITFRTELFIDLETRLPAASVTSGVDRYAGSDYVQEFNYGVTYEYQFVARDTLPPRLFDPAVAYMAPNSDAGAAVAVRLTEGTE
jgi:hypothetical protein